MVLREDRGRVGSHQPLFLAPDESQGLFSYIISGRQPLDPRKENAGPRSDFPRRRATKKEISSSAAASVDSAKSSCPWPKSKKWLPPERARFSGPKLKVSSRLYMPGPRIPTRNRLRKLQLPAILSQLKLPPPPLSLSPAPKPSSAA